MQKSKLKILIIGIVILLLIAGLIWLTIKNRQTSQKNENTKEEFVKVEKDGTKVNISNKLKENKKIDELIITDISIKTKNNETILQANVKNLTNEIKGNYAIKLVIKDKAQNTIKEISGYINTIKPQEQTTLDIKTSYDFANAYDFEIMKQ